MNSASPFEAQACTIVAIHLGTLLVRLMKMGRVKWHQAHTDVLPCITRIVFAILEHEFGVTQRFFKVSCLSLDPRLLHPSSTLVNKLRRKLRIRYSGCPALTALSPRRHWEYWAWSTLSSLIGGRFIQKFSSRVSRRRFRHSNNWRTWSFAIILALGKSRSSTTARFSSKHKPSSIWPSW
jgi:hypothetical protein